MTTYDDILLYFHAISWYIGLGHRLSIQTRDALHGHRHHETRFPFLAKTGFHLPHRNPLKNTSKKESKNESFWGSLLSFRSTGEASADLESCKRHSKRTHFWDPFLEEKELPRHWRSFPGPGELQKWLRTPLLRSNTVILRTHEVKYIYS